MSKITNDLINYINNLYNTDNINNVTKEVEDTINSIFIEDCSKLYIPDISYTVTGIGEDIDTPNYSFLIPNLFRKCYSKNTLLIPNICTKFVRGSNYLGFYPTLIESNLIKSFLYFNFPVNIKNANSLKKNINKIITLDREVINIKKRNQTYGSYTSAVDIFNFIYGVDSMLSQIVAFSNFLQVSSNANSLSLIVCSHRVLWDFTTECLNNNLNIEFTYITGNNNYDYQLTTTSALNIYNLKNILEELSIYDSNYLTFIENSIYGILKYASQVYEDVILEIQSYMLSKKYCRKDYMNVDILPSLFDMYSNFYANQIKTINKNIPITYPYDVIAVTGNIYNYLDQYYIIYTKTYSKRYLVKNIILDEESAITVYSNVNNWSIPQIEITYYYYYININNPSAIQMYNQNILLPSSNTIYTSVDDFINVFNTEYYIYINAVNITYLKEYNSGGLYPQGGTIDNSQNIGKVYNYINEDANTYFLYETLESYAPYDPETESGGKGVGLLYLKE